MANVRDFGAMGDGIHDDSGPLEHAWKAGDGELYFPQGDYRVTRPLVCDLSQRGRLHVHGAGGLAKLIMDGPGPVFDVRGSHARSADPLGFMPTVWQRERMPTFDGLEIEGRHPQADGIHLTGVMQPTLTRLLIRRVRHAVHLTHRARNLLISHCHFYHNHGIGIYLDHVNLHQVNIVGNHISYHRHGGIRIEGGEIRNLQITGNDIEYNNARVFRQGEDLPADEPTAEIFIDCSQGGTVREGTIASNTIQATYSPQGANIRIIGGDAPDRQLVGMLCITGNLIGNQAVNVHITRARGITLTGNFIYSGYVRNLICEECHSLVMSANNFGHNPDYKDKELCTGIRLVDCVHSVLSGGLIQDAQAGRHTLPGAPELQRQGLIELIRCRHLQLQGWQILEGGPYALYLEDCQHTAIQQCSFYETRSEPQTEAAIAWKGIGTGSLVAQCRSNRPWILPDDVLQAANLLETEASR
ncbi:MAG: ATP-binding protein [Planctomycetaceae bacterium]|nr:MAG: ATP-binding protein [Planctomycetaceae bacterium]